MRSMGVSEWSMEAHVGISVCGCSPRPYPEEDVGPDGPPCRINYVNMHSYHRDDVFECGMCNASVRREDIWTFKECDR